MVIKIAIAEADIPESNILTSDEVQGRPGKSLIPRILDMFSINGPNGRHRCLVSEPGMMTVAQAKDASFTRLFELSVARAIAAQVILAVAFLHHRGVVHGGMYIYYEGLLIWRDLYGLMINGICYRPPCSEHNVSFTNQHKRAFL